MTYIIHTLSISAIIISFLCILQATGHDFFATGLGRALIMPGKMDAEMGSLTFTFGDHYAYGTLYNPNYVGVYAILITPLFLTMLMQEEKNIWTIAYLLGLVGGILSVLGAHSGAGKIGIAVELLFLIIFCWRYLLKYIKIIIPMVGVCFLILILLILLIILLLSQSCRMLSE